MVYATIEKKITFEQENVWYSMMPKIKFNDPVYLINFYGDKNKTVKYLKEKKISSKEEAILILANEGFTPVSDNFFYKK